MYAKTLFKGDVDKATDYVDGIAEGETKGQLNSIKDTAEAVLHPIDTVKSLWDVIFNPSETYEKVLLTEEQWTT